MAAPSTPTNFNVTQGNGQAHLGWDAMSGATTYTLQRSSDGVSYSNVAPPFAALEYLDTSTTPNTQYWYKVSANNGDGSSSYSDPVAIVPTLSGFISLGQIRLLAQQRADRVNSNFVTKAEWDTFINQSYYELFDLLTTLYEDYNVAPAFNFLADGRASGTYPLPDGLITDSISGLVARPFYKLLGVDSAINIASNQWLTLKKFNMIGRNQYVFPNSIPNRPFSMRYRLLGSNIEFIPIPSSGQSIRLWYVPRLTVLLRDSDVADCVSGWSEFIVIDAAIKALMKEESDVSTLLMSKAAMVKRIEDSAMNRDAGQPETISDVRRITRPIGWGFDGTF